MMADRITIALPQWLIEHSLPEACASAEDRIRFAIALARRNVAEGTGGPFGAAVFERRTGRLVAAGVNLVVPSHTSIAHAEMVALTLAQQAAGSHDLAPFDYELATSVEPCAMCLGAIPWSGVASVLCGARDADAREVGFDEGAKPADWVAALRQRGIAVTRDVLRKEARAVLTDYGKSGGPIYNPSR